MTEEFGDVPIRGSISAGLVTTCLREFHSCLRWFPPGHHAQPWATVIRAATSLNPTHRSRRHHSTRSKPRLQGPCGLVYLCFVQATEMAMDTAAGSTGDE